MNKYHAEKKKQLMLVSVVAVAVLAGLWFGLLTPQHKAVKALQARRATVKTKYEQIQSALKSAPEVEASLSEASASLAKLEATMASGDLYSWAINLIRDFKANYNVDIPQFSQ